MSTVCVLIAIDVEGALSSSDLSNNIYMMDTDKFQGSSGEGTAALDTYLAIGDTIIWSVAPIDPGTNVQIKSFTGEAVDNKYIKPVQNPLSPTNWLSKFQPPGSADPEDRFQYALVFSFEGHEMTFDPYLVVK
jgi:hypothetical protein